MINIYFGPKIGFDIFLSEKRISDPITLSNLLKQSEERSKEIYVVNNLDELPQKGRIKLTNLVVYSDEYSSVKEHVILNFDGFISNFDIAEDIYLQNPPEFLSNKLKKIFSDTKIEFYTYSTLNKDVLKEINKDYNNIIVGQSGALRQLLTSLIPLTRSKNVKPVVLLLWGPSGVGKTETAKFLSKKLRGELFRKQFSMFQNNEFVTYLFGGNHYEKSFAKELLERETNIILLDEFDKASSVFHSAFYQLFDEGIYEDKNYSVKVESSVIICTSNYDSLENIQEHLGDPIFSRFDACIQFQKLNEESIKAIIDLHIAECINELENEDKEIVSERELQQLFYKQISRLDNARRIKSLVKEVVNSKILDRLLND